MNEIGFFIREAVNVSTDVRTSKKSDDKFLTFLNRAEKNNYNKSISVQNSKKDDSVNIDDKLEKDDTDDVVNNELNLEHEDFIKLESSVLITDLLEEDIADDSDNVQEVDYSTVINNISIILNIPPDEIVSLLDELNISFEDLTEATALNSFLTAAFKVKDSHGLLEISNIAEKINNLKSFLKEIVNNSQTMAIDDSSIDSVNNNVNDIDILQVDNSLQLNNEGFDTEQELEQNFSNNLNADKQKVSKNVNNNHILNMSFNDNIENAYNNELENVNFLNNIDTKFKDLSSPAQLKNKILLPNANEILNQITENLKIEYKGDTSEIRINLKPEHLGDVSLKISTINGLVAAQFVAENSRIKEIIESNFNMLKDSLEEQGIKVQSLSVSVGHHDTNDNMEKFLQEKQKSILRANRIAYNIMNEENENIVISEAGVLGSRVNYRI